MNSFIDRQTSDMKIETVDGKFFDCHKDMLKKIPYFETIISYIGSNRFLRNTQNCTKLLFSSKAVSVLLDYIYSDKIYEKNIIILTEVIELSDYIMCQSLFRECLKVITPSISYSRNLGIYVVLALQDTSLHQSEELTLFENELVKKSLFYPTRDEILLKYDSVYEKKKEQYYEKQNELVAKGKKCFINQKPFVPDDREKLFEKLKKYPEKNTKIYMIPKRITCDGIVFSPYTKQEMIYDFGFKDEELKDFSHNVFSSNFLGVDLPYEDEFSYRKNILFCQTHGSKFQ